MDLLNKLIILRDRSGLKQEEVAQKLNISISSFRRKEKGITQFSVEEFENLLLIYNVTYDDLKNISFPIIHEEIISNNLLDKLERTNEECSQISYDWNINREKYNKIQKALDPVLDERMHSFDFPDLNLEYVAKGTYLKEVILDVRAERLINEAMSIQKKLAHAIFGAEM